MNQKEQVLQYIRDFGSITPAEAFNDLGVYRLAAVIFKLRMDGYKIMTIKEGKRNRYGKMKYYARYKMMGATK